MPSWRPTHVPSMRQVKSRSDTFRTGTPYQIPVKHLLHRVVIDKFLPAALIDRLSKVTIRWTAGLGSAERPAPKP